MSSRENILAKIAQNQPEWTELPDISVLGSENFEVVSKFTEVLESIGGQVIEIESYDEIAEFIKENFNQNQHIITTIAELSHVADKYWQNDNPHRLANAEFAVIEGHFGVAENGSIWVTEDLMGQRVAPFITQYLSIVLKISEILPTMHQAYERIADADYGFGTFIAGPSKTADIEQSLVLGAHGARGLTVFLIAP
jgi:L-lactate dehydrogenase complex protein LldG